MVNQALSDIYRSATVLRANPFISVKWDNRLGKSSCCADVGWNFPGKSSYAIFRAFCFPYSERSLYCWMAVPVDRYHIERGPHADKTPKGLRFSDPFLPDLLETCWAGVSIEVRHLQFSLHLWTGNIVCLVSTVTCKWSQLNSKRWFVTQQYWFILGPSWTHGCCGYGY